jgi:hypothetical protein
MIDLHDLHIGFSYCPKHGFAIGCKGRDWLGEWQKNRKNIFNFLVTSMGEV